MKQDLSHTLHKADLKATPARLSILGLFSKGCHPISAEAIHQKLKKIDLATIYRTLASFEEKGLIKKVLIGDGVVQYERGESHHHHLVCTACGLIEGFDMCGLEPLIKNAVKRSSHIKIVSDHSLELLGLCKTCAKE